RRRARPSVAAGRPEVRGQAREGQVMSDATDGSRRFLVIRMTYDRAADSYRWAVAHAGADLDAARAALAGVKLDETRTGSKGPVEGTPSGLNVLEVAGFEQPKGVTGLDWLLREPGVAELLAKSEERG